MLVDIPVTAKDVKAEAERRITAVYPLWRQANIDRAGGADQAAMVAFINAIRTASNRLEAMAPVPPRFTADHYWSA